MLLQSESIDRDRRRSRCRISATCGAGGTAENSVARSIIQVPFFVGSTGGGARPALQLIEGVVDERAGGSGSCNAVGHIAVRVIGGTVGLGSLAATGGVATVRGKGRQLVRLLAVACW